MQEPSIIPELACSDYSKSLEFYQNTLGFEMLYSREEEGFAMLRHQDSQLMIDEIGKGRTWETGALEKPLGRGINFQIRVENVEALYSTASLNNVPIFLELEEKWYRTSEQQESGNKQFCLQDPDGYLLRFFEDLGERDIE